MDLAGRTAMVTGGALRLGRAVCEALAARQCNLVIHCRRSRKQAAALSRDLRRGGVSTFVVNGDLSTGAGCRAVMRQACRAAGKIDILVNNASVFGCDRIAGMTEKKMQEQLRVNFIGPVMLMREFVRQTAAGKIVNMLDRRVAGNEAGCLPYLLSKKALGELTRSAALELAPGVTVNGVAPGPVLPAVGRGLPPAMRLAGAIPLGRRPAPADIAAAVVFLLESDAITGQILFVDGGQHLMAAGGG
ncbi:MAG: SDR family oxidoreductase [bacterium]